MWWIVPLMSCDSTSRCWHTSEMVYWLPSAGKGRRMPLTGVGDGAGGVMGGVQAVIATARKTAAIMGVSVFKSVSLCGRSFMEAMLTRNIDMCQTIVTLKADKTHYHVWRFASRTSDQIPIRFGTRSAAYAWTQRQKETGPFKLRVLKCSNPMACEITDSAVVYKRRRKNSPGKQ